MAKQTPHPMGRRQQARAAQRKRRRVLAICTLLLLIFLILFIVWLKRESRNSGDAADTSTPPIESEEETSYEPGVSIPIEESEEPTESVVIITEVPEESEEESAEPTESGEPTEEAGSTENKGGGYRGSTGEKGSSGHKGTTGDKTSTGNKGTGNKGTTGNQNNTGTNAGTNPGSNTGSDTGSNTVTTTSPEPSAEPSPEPSAEPSTEPSEEPSAEPSTTPTVTLETVTLTVGVENPLAITKGDTAVVSWVAKDSDGNDISSQCTAVFTTENCTVEGNTVTFTQAGTATVQVAVTYDGTTKSSSTLSYQVNEPIVTPVLTTVTLVELEKTTYEQGDTITLAAAAKDQNDSSLTAGVTFSYQAVNATVSENTVTLDQWGTVTLTVTATQGETEVTSEAVTITVLPKVGDIVLSQKGENETLGSTVYLPGAAKVRETDGETSTEPVTYELTEEDAVVLTVVLSGGDRAKDDANTLEEALEESKAAAGEEATATLNEEQGYYDLSWKDGDTTILVRCYLGDKASNVLTITYTGDREELAKGILDTFRPGELTSSEN